MSTSTDLPLLRASGLARRLGGLTVLHDIDLDLHEGEHLAVVGASGSGKSTLLHTLSGLEAPSAGTLHWAGEDLGALGEAERARHRLLEIGIVFQQFHLLRALTLFDNVVMPGLLARVRPRHEVLARGRELMAVLGVESLAERGVGEASGGQLQRVAIARALINRPLLVVADEPTGALDTAASEGVIDALGDVVADGTALLVVTHDRAIAARASRIVTMADGRISGVETVAAPVA